jgi:hypothetical protein
MSADLLSAVFKDVAAPRARMPSISEPRRSDQVDPQNNPTHQAQQAGTMPDQAAFAFGGSNLYTEDLGQFWLWSMDPHIEDGESWQCGDEF